MLVPRSLEAGTMRRRMGLAITAAALALAGLAAPPAPTSADETTGICDVKVSINSGPLLEGGIEYFRLQGIAVQGFGFPPASRLEIIFAPEGQPPGVHRVTADSSGGFVRHFQDANDPGVPRNVLLTVYDLANVAGCVDTVDMILLPAPHFIDINGTRFWRDIIWLYEAGLTAGCDEIRFCPSRAVTRGQMAAFLVRALDLQPTEEDFFTDDEGSTYEDSINRLAAAGVATGCGPDAFCPRGWVTRGEMASFLVRGFALPPSSEDVFTDDDGSTHEADINALAASGITTGCRQSEPDLFCPDRVVTRDQMAAFLFRALN